MKLLILSYLVLLVSSTLEAFEPGQLSLDSVSNFEDGDAGFTIRHRFYGKANDIDTFFGLDEGANTYLSLRYAPIKELIFEVHHTSANSENSIRLGYAHKFSFLHTQINLSYFSFKDLSLQEEDRSNLFANLVFQTPLIFEHVTLTSNLGFDRYYDAAGAGIGLEISTENLFPQMLTFTQRMSILAEYYTKYDKVEGLNRPYNAYAFGVKFKTFAHHFELLMTNATGVDPRTMFQGSNTNDLHFAFNINRKF